MYLLATDYISNDGKTDVSARLQRLINENPNRTIFFPDGVYLLKKPITTPAHPERAVDLQLSNFAQFLASDDWDSDEAMIRLGGQDPCNNILMPGSNYGLQGGIINGNGKAKAISIDSGRETYIRNTNIKNAFVGIHIKYGANNGSSDSDIMNVNITGNGHPDSIGVLIEGYDNTLTNMRIYNMFTGVEVKSGGNMLRNIHPLVAMTDLARERYTETVGFRISEGGGWYDYCYSDQFATGFHLQGQGHFHNCFCFWYSNKETHHVAVRSDRPFHGIIHDLTIGGASMEGYPNRFTDEDFVLGENGSIQKVTLGESLLYK